MTNNMKKTSGETPVSVGGGVAGKKHGAAGDMTHYGYVRVSAQDQNPERQLIAMKDEGIAPCNLYVEKMSGKDFSRPVYMKLLNVIGRGDVLVIKSIDRLGRNYSEILEEWRRITKEIGADIQVLDMPLLNTNARHDDLTGVFISDLVLQILAYVAETERSFIRQRQAEGIAAAKANGVRFGNKRVKMPEGFEESYRLWLSGELSIRQAAKQAGINYSTFYRRCMERKMKSRKGSG